MRSARDKKCAPAKRVTDSYPFCRGAFFDVSLTPADYIRAAAMDFTV